MVTFFTLLITICICNGKSFGFNVDSNCPTVETHKARLQKLYNDADPTDFADSLSDDAFMYCQNSGTDCKTKTEFLALLMGYGALVSFYDLSYSNIKIGTHFTQSDIVIFFTVENGGCTYGINGAFNLFCDANGKIIQDQDFLNEEEVATTLYNAVRADGCVPPQSDESDHDSDSDSNGDGNSDSSEDPDDRASNSNDGSDEHDEWNKNNKGGNAAVNSEEAGNESLLILDTNQSSTAQIENIFILIILFLIFVANATLVYLYWHFNAKKTNVSSDKYKYKYKIQNVSVDDVDGDMDC